jgi:hypothetical protein
VVGLRQHLTGTNGPTPHLGSVETLTFQDAIGWVASAATMIAAMMTAANLGARVTGWGFVVFTVGSVAWATVGMLSGQTSLLITNGFLLIVNAFGVWRWLGRQARYEQGSASAADRSRRRRNAPTLFSSGWLNGAKVEDCNGDDVGVVVDSMLDCERMQLAYIVVGQGGIGGAGETLRAIAPDHFSVSEEAVHCELNGKQIEALPPITPDAWPTVAPKSPFTGA